MKIEIILPDTALVGSLTYLNIDTENGHAELCNVLLGGMEDGKFYDAIRKPEETE